jgi:hypothetical protein
MVGAAASQPAYGYGYYAPPPPPPVYYGGYRYRRHHAYGYDD